MYPNNELDDNDSAAAMITMYIPWRLWSTYESGFTV